MGTLGKCGSGEVRGGVLGGSIKGNKGRAGGWGAEFGEGDRG